jgi:hypothetical protein
LYDLPATVTSKDESGSIELLADVTLKNVDRKVIEGTASKFDIIYKCDANETKIFVKSDEKIEVPTAFVLPIVSPNSEKVTIVNENEITIQKPEGLVTIKANTPIKMKDIEGKRTFNMVPGVEALPFEIFFGEKQDELIVSIAVS